MLFFNRLTAVFLAALLLGPVAPLQARTRKGDKYLAQGKAHEQKAEWDDALQLYEQAMSEDPADVAYQMAATKARFQAAQMHLDKGLKVRTQGQLGEALMEFQKAYAVNPGSSAAEQELRRTRDMIDRERQKAEQTGKESPPEERALTPAEIVDKDTQERISRMLGIPELKPLNPAPINLKMNSQAPRVLFETVAKVAGLNILFDPDFNTTARQSVDLADSNVEQALDYLAVLTKSIWKPLSPNTIFITLDNPTKRRDYVDNVMKIFYLSNVNTPQELQEIVAAIRSVAELQRLFTYNEQYAIIAKGEEDQVALAEKIINDLDKPRSEVVVDIIVMEADKVVTRSITAALASQGLNVPVSFSPRSSIAVPTTTAAAAAAAAATTSTSIPLSHIGKVNFGDYSVVLPSALLNAVLSDANTKVLQSPQIRSVDNVKATLKIGDRQPTATGSFQPGVGGVGINPLVNTQFQYIDVGVNVDLTPHVHDNGEVSMHIELEISNVANYVDLGGIKQPVIGQRKVVHDIRMRDGAINLLGGLQDIEETKTVTGVPGLSSIPLLRRLFTGESVTTTNKELMIALIPHIVRRTELTADNLRGIATGNGTTIKLNYAPREVPPGTAAASPASPPVAALPPTPAAPPVTAPPITAPPATAPPATAPPPPPPAPAPAGAARVGFLPASLDTTLSSPMTVSLTIEGAQDAASAPLQIQFDPKVVRLNDVTLGDFFGRDGVQPSVAKNILNDTGIAAIQINRPPGTPGISGSGLVLTLSLQAVGRGQTTVTIPNLVVRNARGEVIATGSPQFTVNVR